MQVNETVNEGLKRGYHITVPAEELDEKVDQKLSEAQPDVEMKGFRRGKVPMALLRRQFGDRLFAEVMQEAVDGAVSRHFEDTGDRPAMQPEVKMKSDGWKKGDDVEVEMTYEKLPDIPELDAASIEIERLNVRADDAAVDEALASLAENSKSFETKQGPAEDGDQVVIDFEGSVDGETFEGGTAQDYPLVLGSNSFIPGFEGQLLGAAAGDSVDVKVSFPEEYQAPNLAGKDAAFSTTVKDVKAPKPTEIDDEMAKQYGASDLDALKAQIRDRLEMEYNQAARQVLKRRLLDILDERVKFDLPPSLVQAEADQIAHQLWHEENPDHKGHDHDKIEPTEEHLALAERRVRLGLFLAELGRKNEISVTDAEMTQAVMSQARQYPGQERQFFEFVQQNAQMKQQIQAPLFEDKVVDFIVERANVEEKSASQDDLQKAVEALEADVETKDQ